jgi:parvulin-like peptidyl-prolyl isomerase
MKIQDLSSKIVLFALLCIMFSGFSVAASGNKENMVLLKVNGKEVYGRDFDVSLRKHIKKINLKNVSEEDKKELVKKLRRARINKIVQAVRMEQEAKRLGIDMSVEKINAFVNAKAAKSFATAEEYKSGIMRHLGMSELDAEKHFKRVYIKERLADVKFKNKVQVTENDIDTFLQKKNTVRKNTSLKRSP